MRILLGRLGLPLIMAAVFAAPTAGAQAPSATEWSVYDPSGGGEAAVLSGSYSGGKQHGNSRLIVTCQHKRLGCADCGKMAEQMITFYQFSWIIPSVPAFYFDPIRLGGGAQEDLATLGVSPNPPTPRHLHATVTNDQMWRIDILAKPEDITALREGETSNGKVTLVLHSFDNYGLPAITMTNTIPPVGPSLQTALDACSSSRYQSRDVAMCEPQAGRELIEAKVCWGLGTQHCETPELSKDGALWRLTPLGPEVPESDRYYKLSCGYKNSGAADVVTEIWIHGLSAKLKECDETLKPLTVSCK
jgi:hypothetical protein